MDLIAFSIKTKGMHNFVRRLWTVFLRFGFSETRTRRALWTMMESLSPCSAAPTFFIPAAVLKRYPALIKEMALCGAEIGIHGYIHNDYRFLSEDKQYEQTRRAQNIFEELKIPYQGFRNPYLGWNEASLRVFTALNLAYESNDAVLHDVITVEQLPSVLRKGYEKSLELFQVLPCTIYTIRPHFEGSLVRIPTSVPDDEMLFDRLRITQAERVGRIWSMIMQHVYELGGPYTLNLHPERSILCKQALEMLLDSARHQACPVWITRLEDIAEWWKERGKFRFQMTPLAAHRWQVEVSCTPRATILARNIDMEGQTSRAWFGNDICLASHSFVVKAETRPSIGVSLQTPQSVFDFLLEQGYCISRCTQKDADTYAYYLDMQEGLGDTRGEQVARRSALVEKIEQLEVPLLHFGCWPDGCRAALAVSGDIDSVTIQDFFWRIFEVRKIQ